MNKVLLGLLLGAVLGAVDGLTAWFTPAVPASVADARHAGWRRAVDRSRGWAG